MEWTKEQCRQFTESIRKSVKINFRPWAKLIAKDLSERFDDVKIADVACGPAFMCVEINKLMPDAKFILADSAGPMIEIALEEAKKAGFDVESAVCPAESMKLDDNCCEAVVCKQFFHEAENIEKSISEIFRVLKPGGRAYLIDFDADGSKSAAKKIYWFLRLTENKQIAEMYMHNFSRGLPHSKVMAIMSDAGFVDTEFQPKGPNYYITGTKGT